MSILSFEERATSGRYDELALAFDKKADSLATVDYGTHFTSESFAWRDGDVKNHRTIFVPMDQSSEEGTNEEVVINIIGEVAREGSELGARGNAWLKHGGAKILDSSPVRDILVLTLPAMATEPLEILYENQICTLNDVEEKVALPVPKARLTLFTSLSFSLLILSRRRPRSPAAFGKQILKDKRLLSRFRSSTG
jgi:hypothetical protein